MQDFQEAPRMYSHYHWLKLRISQPGSEYQEENDQRQFPLPMMNGMILVVPDVFQSITYR